jgi:hypothetical protein
MTPYSAPFRRSRRALLGLVVLAPGAAAGMDWLTPHLESQRFGNQLRRNQRARERTLQGRGQTQSGTGGAAAPVPQGGAQPPPAAPARGQPTMAQRQAAWSRHRAEYQRRLLRDGQASADRWLDGHIRAGR